MLGAGTGLINLGGRVRGDLSGIALNAARAFPVPTNAPGPFPIYEISTTGELRGVTQLDGTLSDIFLRTDGQNEMQANIRGGGNRLEDVTGIDFENGSTIEQTGPDEITISSVSGLNIPMRINLPDGVQIQNTANGVLQITAPNGVEISDLLTVEDIRINARGGELLTNLLPRHSITVNDGFVDFPPCTTGRPAIFAGPVMMSNNADGLPILAVQPNAIVLASRWQVTFRILVWDVLNRTSFWITPDPAFGRLLTIAVCI